MVVASGRKTDFDELLRLSDYISIHCPLTENTAGLFNDKAFSKMKDGAILINTAHGPIVDEAALCRALESGRLAAAGIDVYDKEPLDAESTLRDFENVTLTDHAA